MNSFKPPTKVLVEEYLATNPKASAAEISRHVCSKQRRSYVTLSGSMIKEMRAKLDIKTERSHKNFRLNYEKIDKLITDNPDMSYQDFSKQIKLSLGSFLKARKRLLGIGSTKQRKGDRLYFKVCSFPTDKLSLDAKRILKEFITVLNASGRISLEVVELIDPPQLEIREAK